MKSEIKLHRVVLNILFFLFYILSVSIIFSFTFPAILVLLGKEILAPSDPIFDKIQIAILVIVPVFSLIFRRYFYLPIMDKYNIDKIITKKETIKEEIKDKKINKIEKISYKEKVNNKTEIKTEIKEETNNTPKLDIKLGKEIK